MINGNLYEHEIRVLERRIRDKGYDNPVVFYGSSSVRLWKSLDNDFPEYDILNLGFGGSTLDYCSYYFERLVKPADPASFVLYAGDNDIGEGRTASEVYSSFTSLYEKFRHYFPDIKFTYISIKPSISRLDRIERIKEANKLIEEFLLPRDKSYFVNVFDSMINGNNEIKNEYFTPDKLHMNSNGYKLWKSILGTEAQNIF